MTGERPLRRVSVRVPRERAEEARALAVELFPEGFAEIEREDGVEIASYVSADWDARLAALGPVVTEDVVPGWDEAWKRFHRPVRLGPLWVGPPWETPDGDAIAVVVDPGRAFGTGGHPTTRLCLDLLLSCDRSSLVDLGCGSGVIAIAAAKLGFEPVTALDADPVAIEAARANAAVNGVAIELQRADALSDELPGTDVAVANITLDAVQAVARRIDAKVLVTSGYLAAERPSAGRWAHRARRTAGGWAADLFTVRA